MKALKKTKCFIENCLNVCSYDVLYVSLFLLFVQAETGGGGGPIFVHVLVLGSSRWHECPLLAWGD